MVAGKKSSRAAQQRAERAEQRAAVLEQLEHEPHRVLPAETLSVLLYALAHLSLLPASHAAFVPRLPALISVLEQAGSSELQRWTLLLLYNLCTDDQQQCQTAALQHGLLSALYHLLLDARCDTEACRLLLAIVRAIATAHIELGAVLADAGFVQQALLRACGSSGPGGGAWRTDARAAALALEAVEMAQAVLRREKVLRRVVESMATGSGGSVEAGAASAAGRAAQNEAGGETWVLLLLRVAEEAELAAQQASAAVTAASANHAASTDTVVTAPAASAPSDAGDGQQQQQRQQQ